MKKTTNRISGYVATGGFLLFLVLVLVEVFFFHEMNTATPFVVARVVLLISWFLGTCVFLFTTSPYDTNWKVGPILSKNGVSISGHRYGNDI